MGHVMAIRSEENPFNVFRTNLFGRFDVDCIPPTDDMFFL
jgi:hypothetical protein